MKLLKKTIMALFCLSLFMLTGCNGYGKLDEGDISCQVVLNNMPIEFYKLPDNVKEYFEVIITLTSTSTGKKYDFVLNEANSFSCAATLDPGSYKLLSYSCESVYVPNIEINFSADELIVTENGNNTLSVSLLDADALIAWINASTPYSDIICRDMFSRVLQLEGSVISMTDIIDTYVFDHASDMVAPHNQAVVSNTYYGLEITVVNNSAASLYARDCEISKISCTTNYAVFPGGASLASTPEEIFHATNGIYGIPTHISGDFLYGSYYNNQTVEYIDEISGDKITILIDAADNRIISIDYEFAVYK